ncbi:MAG: hypothetical protein ACTHWQ_08190 [Sphingobacterium sp.]
MAGMTVVASEQSGCYLRWERVEQGGRRLVDQEIIVETNPKTETVRVRTLTRE